MDKHMPNELDKGDMAADQGNHLRDRGGTTDDGHPAADEGDSDADQGGTADDGHPAADEGDSDADQGGPTNDGHPDTEGGNPASDEEQHSSWITSSHLLFKIPILSSSGFFDFRHVPQFMKAIAVLLVSNYVVRLIKTIVGIKPSLLWFGVIIIVSIFKLGILPSSFTRRNRFHYRNDESLFNMSTPVNCINVIVWYLVPLFYVLKFLLKSDLQYTSVWCSAQQYQLRTCHFKNLYYDTHRGFSFLLDESSVISGIYNFEEFKNLKLSPIADHKGVNMEITMVRSADVASLSEFFYSLFFESINFVEERHFLLYRFKPDNFMHVVHDDLIPLFFKFRELSLGSVGSIVSSINLFFADINDHGPYARWYQALSSSTPLLAKDMSPMKLYCFSSLYMGLSNTSFYQYGFGQPQGPIRPNLNGRDIEEFKRYYLDYFGVGTGRTENELKITLISRKVNRRIINEQKVFNTLSTLAKQDAFYNEKMLEMAKGDMIANKNEMLNHVASSDIVVAMHGAETILSLFLPDSSVFIELFPFGIFRENVSPLYSLSRAKEVHFRYLSWHNVNEENSIAHPEFTRDFGGTEGFPEELKRKINDTKRVPAVPCCNNPLYLFRMYQDTIIDDSFSEVASTALKLLKSRNPVATAESQWFFPGPVSDLNCHCHLNHVDVSWRAPHNVEHLQIEYDVMMTADSVKRNVFTSESRLRFDFLDQARTVQVWVSSAVNGKKSIDSYCTCGFLKKEYGPL